MAKIFLLLIWIFADSNLIAQSKNSNLNSGNLVIKIVGIESDDGKIMAALSNSRENYQSRDTAYIGVVFSINNGEAKYTFENIPFGEYAIKVYHDENDNGEMDTNFLGIPSEDYGFSNNASGTFGPADYDDAKFRFEESGMVMLINLD